MAEQNLKMVIGAEDKASAALKGVEQRVSGLSGALSKHFTAAKAASNELAIGLGAVAAGVGTLAVNAVKTAGNFQVYEKQMQVLLGSTDAAKQRIEELKEFGATTPFELPGVVRASIVLETLTKGALATGEGLRLVGDVAAGTNQPFEDIAVHIGRIYDAMQSGRPFGESAMRLQELGAISGETRGVLEAMTEKGADFSDMWAVLNGDLGRFGGMMQEMNDTIPGQWSNLMDSISNTLGGIGEKLDETFQIKEKIQSASDAVADFGKNFDSILGTIDENKNYILALSGAITFSLIPALIGAVGAIGKIMFVLSPWALAGALIFTNFDKVKGLLEGLTPVIVGVGFAFAYAKKEMMMEKILSTLFGGATTLKGAMLFLSMSFRTAALSVKTFFASLGPIGWAIMGIGAAATAFAVAWNKDWGGIREKTEWVVNKVIDMLNLMLEKVQLVGNKLGMDWDLTMNHVSFTTNEMVNSVSGSVSTLVSNVQNAFSFTGKLLSGNKEAWGAVGSKVTSIAAQMGIDINKIKASVKTMATSGSKDLDKFGGAASSAAKEVEKLEENMNSMENRTAKTIVRVQAKYEDLRSQLEKLAKDHRDKVASILEDIGDIDKKISDLTDPKSDRTVDFKKQAAEQVVDIERKLKEERESLSDEEIRNLEKALSDNKEFIKSIESEVNEARKVARMDELSRTIYLFNRETETLRNEYLEQKTALQEKLNEENELYEQSVSKISKTMRRLLHAQIDLRGRIEDVTQESLNNEHAMLDEAMTGYLDLIESSADSPELKHFASTMDSIIAKANAAIAAAQKASKISSSIKVSSSSKEYALGGVSSGFPSGVYNSPVWNPNGDVAGEAGPEAIVPLPNGRSIPVDLRGGGARQSGGVSVQVNITGGMFANGVKQFSRELMQEVTRELSRRGVKLSAV